MFGCDVRRGSWSQAVGAPEFRWVGSTALGLLWQLRSLLDRSITLTGPTLVVTTARFVVTAT